VKRCTWVLMNGQPCNKKTRYTMMVDDTGYRCRSYAPFCDEHMTRHLQQERVRERTEEEV
jgi:hypothetical protein